DKVLSNEGDYQSKLNFKGNLSPRKSRGRAKYACAGAVAEDQKRTSCNEDGRRRSGPETPIRPDQQRDRPWGEPGDSGEKGNPGEEGRRGFMGETGKNAVGAPGRKGIKGPQGRQGIIGFKGEEGEPGVVGERGKNGEKGQREKNSCPVYPTELVFALDMSSDVKPLVFNRIINIVTYIMTNVTVRGGNCPVGARVAVMSYNKHTNYLVRFSDFQNKDKLLNAIKNISLESSNKGRDLGSCMRFVSRNVFKRSLQGATVRRIAVFFSNGRTEDPAAISTAAMEYNAFGIIPAVIAFSPAPVIKRAFSIDDSGTLIELTAKQFEPQVQPLLTCTLCYDRCKPDALCGKSNSALMKPMDVGFLLDSSYNMNLNEYEAARSFISTVIDALDIPKTGARVAMVSSAPPGFSAGNQGKPYLEFDFSTNSNTKRMKRHLQENTHRLQDPPVFGDSLKWMLENIMAKTSDLKKNKAIIMILSGETSEWDKETLKEASLEAKCKGFALFVVLIGKTYNNTELKELPSSPTEHHLLELSEVHKTNFEYATRFTRAFLNSVKWRPRTPLLKPDQCKQLQETNDLTLGHSEVLSTSSFLDCGLSPCMFQVGQEEMLFSDAQNLEQPLSQEDHVGECQILSKEVDNHETQLTISHVVVKSPSQEDQSDAMKDKLMDDEVTDPTKKLA
ncbi:unnamed protein product, partial [Ranitomeya imitator]